MSTPVPSEALKVHPHTDDVLAALAADPAAATMAVLWLAANTPSGEITCDQTYTGDPTVAERPRYVEVQFNLELVEGHLAAPPAASAADQPTGDES